MALTQENIDLIAQTVRTVDSNAQRSVQGTDVTPLIDGSTIWATDRRTPFRWSPTDTNAAVAYQIVKPDSGLPGSWLLSGGSGIGAVDVWSIADLPAPAAGVITLAASTRYVIHGDINLGTNVIAAPNGSSIEGQGGALLVTNNTVPLITAPTGGTFTICNIGVTNNGGPALTWTGDGDGSQLVMHDVNFYGITACVMITGVAGDYINIYNCGFQGTTQGLQIDGVWASIVLNDLRFRGGGNDVQIISGGAGDISLIMINGCEFRPLVAGEVGVTQNTAGSVTTGRIVGCSFNVGGGALAVDATVGAAPWAGVANVGVADW